MLNTIIMMPWAFVKYFLMEFGKIYVRLEITLIGSIIYAPVPSGLFSRVFLRLTVGVPV